MSTFHATAVAAAIAAKMPFDFPVIPTPSTDPSAAGEAITAAFAGNPGASISIIVTDEERLTDGSAGGELSDRLHSVFEAAVAVLDEGTLGELRQSSAADLFTAVGAQRFDLVDADGNTVARAAIRIDGSAETAKPAPGRINRIAGVDMDLVVEIGRVRMPVRDVLALEPGQVVELDRVAGSPADIRLNGRLIAHGTVVVSDSDYAVRIERILDDAEAA
ncbi:FliM/FliN family flagellar motor switch protein [Microbacterium suaedae]|uniref:FliM/FliN family flagellar motor switch protein n=1 Tax=Microbacterium suaedae TaxID=2067813 RepID=UPI000DA1AB1A|nr:FliM/FliN family flagellar motor switch protein [Microbacterium suaedae]